MAKSVWFVWQRHRRSQELAKAFGAKLIVFDEKYRSAAWRYAILSVRTIRQLSREKPAIVFAQNPSIVLASLLGLVKKTFGFYLVIDRHSNFKLDKDGGVTWKAFHFLSRYSVRQADCTIVTNDYLAEVVRRLGGTPFIMPDRLPELQFPARVPLKGERNAVFVCSFDPGEPVEEVMEAARLLGDICTIYITGNYTKRYSGTQKNLPRNVFLTGYLPEEEYVRLIGSADILVVLTKQEHTLNCGAYEGVTAGKPLVLAGTDAIRGYFRKGVVYCDPENPRDIARAIGECFRELSMLEGEIGELRGELETEWAGRFREFVSRLPAPPP